MPDAVTDAHRRAFRTDLLSWFDTNHRAMPWRETGDPYHIWLSEIMLQQTRVDQARPYYEQFLVAFPTVEGLAAAQLDDVLKAWEGMGYYSRARNLHRAAQQIAADFGGQVPESYDSLRALPGVGPYTAAAVASIAFDLPYAVLDGNVMRVLTRIFTIADDITNTPSRRRLQTLADDLLDPQRPGDFNQAIMELGATVCTPTNPACLRCPLRAVCGAFAAGTQTDYPVKKKKAPVPHYDIAAGLLFNDSGHLLIQRRPEDALLGGLWEFPGGKRKANESLEATCRRELREELGIEVEIVDLFGKVDHAYSHFKITLYAFRCRVRDGTPHSLAGLPLRWVTVDELNAYAFPRANRHLIDSLTERAQNPTLFDTP